jgi:hypothetical protein
MLSITERQNKRKSTVDCIANHNQKGEVMLASSDVFKLDDEALTENQEDWKGWNIQVTSSRIDYRKNTVTHHTDSTMTKPLVIKLKSIPSGWPIYFDKLLESKEGLDFVKAIYGDIQITKEKLISEFERISGKTSDLIRFWIPSPQDRKNNPLRAVWLFFVEGEFVVDCNWYVDGWYVGGCSRGVINSAAKQQSKISTENDIYNKAIDEAIKKLQSMKK